MKVAIFDSGTGGLSVFSRFINAYPSVDATYLGDVMFFPYGTKDAKDLIVIIERIIKYFKKNQYDYLLIACNTASIIYDQYLKQKYQGFVYDVIMTTAHEAYHASNNKRIGIIGTEYTIGSRIYEDKLNEQSKVQVLSLPCSDLVEMCEKKADDIAVDRYIMRQFKIFKHANIDTFILGCTHYNILYNKIKEFFNHKVNVISSGYALINTLDFNDVNLNRDHLGHYTILTTGNPKEFEKKKNHLYDELNEIKVEQLNI